MTASVSPAIAMPVPPAAARNVRRGEASDAGFDEALGAAGTRPGHHAARRDVEANAHRWRHQDADHDTKVEPTVDVPVAQAPAAEAAEARVEDIVVASGTAEPDDAASADGEDDGSLPVQIKAQHAISAMMASVPAQPTQPPAVHDTAKSGEAADRDDSAQSGEATGTAPHQVRVATLTVTVEKTAPTTAAPAVGNAPDAPLPQVNDAADQLGAAATKDGKTVMEATRPARAPLSSRPEARTVATEPSSVAAPAPARIDQGGEQPDAGARDERHAAPEQRRGEAQSVAAKVQVVSQQAAPAPVAVPTPNAPAIVAAIDAHRGLRPAAGLSLPTQAAQPMRSLKIQLHPAELGMVTANLRAAGDQLSVELHVESSEAYHRLSADSDAIVKSLRTLGYDIDRVSILQPQAASTGVSRADTATGATPLSRDGASFQAGNSGNGEGRAGGQAGGRGGRDDAQHGEQAQQVRRDRPGSGLYI